MVDIPDHPDIVAAERTGYPRGHREPPKCKWCGKELSCSDPVYYIDGDWCCEECTEDYIEEQFLLSDIATALGLEKINAEDLEERNHI